MSTKIYYGYRCSMQDLNPAIEWLRIKMWRNVIAYAKAHGWTQYHVIEERQKEFIGEAGFHVWIGNHVVLFSLFGLPKLCEIGGRPPVWLREFSYWNNSDPPTKFASGAGAREWTMRRNLWNEVALDGDRWDARLTNIVFDHMQLMKLTAEVNPDYRKAWQFKTDSLLSRRELPR